MSKYVEITTILSGMQHLYPYLKTRKITNHICHYKDKIFIKECIKNNSYFIRIWKSNSIFDLWYDSMHSYNFIAALDYEINTDHIKIEYLNINDKENMENLGRSVGDADNYLDEFEAKQMVADLIEYTENIARQNDKKKIIKDVHKNLRFYNKYFKDYGFIETSRHCIDNPYWKEVEKILD